ncbi:MAG: cytochrome c peroxidase [Bacteroidota bacterium]|nr:cytochrome c peroxidase [Bacteroidota bacterium]
MTIINIRNLSRLLCLLMMMLFAGCSEDKSNIVPDPTPYNFEIPPFFPTQLNIPEDNPMTVEGIDLGRNLFYDGRIIGRANEGKYMSCGTCHRQENSFEIGLNRPFPIGIDGGSTHNVMLPMINLVWNQNGYGWNGSVTSIEQDVIITINSSSEFNSSPEAVVNAIENIDGYAELFEKAFGTKEVTIDRVAKAISQFIRTLISYNSRFDKYMRGDVQLTDEELSGFILFTTEEGADCFHCHGGDGNPLFTTNLFYNHGFDSLFSGANEDFGDRYHITGDEMDRGAYKATTLRNIEFTGPYMHDGRYETLEEVIDAYSFDLIWSPYINPLMHHISDGGILMTPKEKNDLMAFLRTLSDYEFLENKDFGAPDEFPDGATLQDFR